MSTGEQPAYPDVQGDWLTLKQAAAQLGISPRTARRWIREGKLAGELMPGPYGEQYMVPAGQINTAQEITDVVKVDRQADMTTLAAVLERHLANRDDGIADLVAAVEGLRVEGRQADQRLTDTLQAELAEVRRELAELRDVLEARHEHTGSTQSTGSTENEERHGRVWWKFWDRG
jgi:excisionase family DNA binding protein